MWFRIKFPEAYNYDDSLSCIYVNENINLNCYLEDDYLFIDGMNATLETNISHVIKLIGIKNPTS